MRLDLVRFPSNGYAHVRLWRDMQDQILTQLGAALVSGSLTDEALLAETGAQPVLPILPDANVVKIGGQSIIDRGRAAVFPLLDEIVANLPSHKMIIGTGAGTRARHAYSVGLDLGMPTGVMSVLGTFVSMQNARMLHYLLAKHGIPFIEPAQFAQLPLYLEERRAVIFFGMPPYIFWQQNPAVGRIPPHRTDTGAYLVSEVFGARSMIYVKDEDGLYTADPKKDQGRSSSPRSPSPSSRQWICATSSSSARARHDERRPAPALDSGHQRTGAGQPHSSPRRRARRHHHHRLSAAARSNTCHD